MKTKHTLAQNFKFAFEGVVVGVKRGRNIKIMIGMGLLAIITAAILQIDTASWGILIITISIVLSMETMNTALEAVVDLVSPEYNEKAKIAKDMAAGAVLIASIGSVIIGTLLFLPKIF